MVFQLAAFKADLEQVWIKNLDGYSTNCIPKASKGTLLVRALREGNLSDVAAVLVQQRADVNAVHATSVNDDCEVETRRASALQIAILSNELDIVRQLLAFKADVNAIVEDDWIIDWKSMGRKCVSELEGSRKNQHNALLAALQSSGELMTLLLKSRADANQKLMGQTALEIANHNAMLECANNDALKILLREEENTGDGLDRT